jgi:5-formyltetrahydrofolate cyclo-ligase
MHAAKDELRQKMRRLRSSLDPREAERLAALAAPHLVGLSDLASVRRVALYAPVRGEIATRPLHDALSGRGIACAYPRIAADGPLEFVDAAPADLVADRLGIPSPAADATPVPLADIDVFVVPGLAFDLDGERLGWGHGHYDRTLAGAPAALRVGYAYGFQIVAAVPIDADDEHVDLVVTETGALRARKPHRRLR